jgi:hypothetical protein
MQTRYEHIKFNIERFDHYYDTVNNKGAFYIAINTFIFGGLCAGYISLHKELETNPWIWICIVPLLLCCLLSLIFTCLAIRPFTKGNYTNDDKTSLMFFGGIARHELQYLKEKIMQRSEDEIIEDAIEQMHCLSKGLDGKFKNLRLASNFLQVEFICLVPLFFLITQNLK